MPSLQLELEGSYERPLTLFSKSLALLNSNRTLRILAVVSGLASIVLLIAGATVLPTDVTSLDESQSIADLAEANDDADEAEIEFDFENSADSVPEALRATIESDPFITSTLGPLGLLQTFEPQNPVQFAGDFDREAILDDYRGYISDAFKIPEPLRDRVGFWFDVYTKYDSHKRIIHHSEYPWIVYKVVDVSFIIESDTPRRLWMRREKADRFVKSEALRVQAALKSLGRKKSLKNLTEIEAEVANALSVLGGNVQKNARIAAKHVRVQTGQKNFFFEGLVNSKRFLPAMEEVFRSRGLPVELTRIPFVESSFNRHATSKVGAAGIWQFMSSTGRKFMLVDGPIDERRSPLKATAAAATLLKENHMILYRSWPLAITAWNHGPGGIRRAIQGAGSRDIATIIRKYRSKSFDFASSNFYTEFLAALHAEKYSREIFGPVEGPEYIELHPVKLTRSVRFNEFLRASGLTLEELLVINPELTVVAKKNLVLNRGFKLHLPAHALENLERMVVALHRERPARPKTAG